MPMKINIGKYSRKGLPFPPFSNRPYKLSIKSLLALRGDHTQRPLTRNIKFAHFKIRALSIFPNEGLKSLIYQNTTLKCDTEELSALTSSVRQTICGGVVHAIGRARHRVPRPPYDMAPFMSISRAPISGSSLKGSHQPMPVATKPRGVFSVSCACARHAVEVPAV